MKLKIEGDYVKDGILNFAPCQIIMEFGKIQQIKFENRPIFIGHNPSYNSEYRIEKIYYEKYLKSLKHTYRILYHNENEETKTINIKPNLIEVFRIKWAFNQYLLLSKEIKIGVLKSIVIGILGFLGGIIFEAYAGILETISSENKIEMPIVKEDKLNSESESEIQLDLEKDTLNIRTEKPNAQQNL